MARQLRIEYEGAIYHLLSRGDGREDIYWDDIDRGRFLQLLQRAYAKTGWEVHAYCLLSNHVHLVVETPRANLCAGMRWLLGSYTMAFNRRHRLSGHLFARRHKSLLVDESSPLYLRAVCDYVHLNPARAGMIKPEEPLQSYRWSSYPSYLVKPRAREGWLRCGRLLGEHGFVKETRRSRLELSRRLEALRLEKAGRNEKEIREGWIYGSEDFLARLLERFDKELSENHRAEERTQTETEIAQRIVRVGMKEFGCAETQLRTWRKGDLRKVTLAEELRENTSMTLAWIARRLAMGSWTNVSNLLAKNCQKFGLTPIPSAGSPRSGLALAVVSSTLRYRETLRCFSSDLDVDRDFDTGC